MPRTISLNGAHPDGDDVVLVKLFEKTYRLRRFTRSVQKQIEEFEKRLTALRDKEDANVDDVMKVMAEGLDAVLVIDGNHRTPASKIILAKWEADELTPAQIEGYYEQLTEVAADRPT